MENILLEDGVFHIQLHLTNRCNLKCRHCYEGERTCIEEWDYEELIGVVQQLENAFFKWSVNGEISLVGGEPTLYPELSRLMYRIYESKYIKRFAILTNGVYFSDELMQTIIDTKPTVQISIDGINRDKHDYIRGKGNYDKAINNIKKLVKNGITVFVHYVISKYTVPITWEFIEDMERLGVKQITFSRDVPIGFSDKSIMIGKQEMKALFDQLNRYSNRLRSKNSLTSINTSRPLWAIYDKSGRCPVGLQTLTILHDGTVYPCRRLPIKIGNIKKESIFSIWYNSDVLWNLRHRERIDACSECKHLDDCGGARCVAYAVTGDYLACDPQCWRY